MANKFVTFLQKVGRDLETDFNKILPYTPLLDLIPGAAPIVTAVTGTIITVEQKFTAMGKQSGTGSQKLAQVIAIIGPAVAQMLGTAGKPADEATVTKYINDIVAVLNDVPATSIPAV
jgi:hypothetical protein